MAETNVMERALSIWAEERIQAWHEFTEPVGTLLRCLGHIQWI